MLPPLLYSAAVSMPTMEFRRDFSAISGLSVLLVLLSAAALGVFFAWAIGGWRGRSRGRARRASSPRNTGSDTQNWHTIELRLEGAIFLIVG